jgi:hypothetical protein
MSTGPLSFEPEGDDPAMELAQFLIRRTELGFVQWQNHPNGFTATLRKALVADFVTLRDNMGERLWRLFTLRDRETELIRIAPHLDPPQNSPLAQALDTLYRTVTKPGPKRIY